MDTLYGGLAGEPYLPDTIDQIINVSDDKWCPNKTNFSPDDVIPSHQAPLFAIQNEEELDIRPRFFDADNDRWVLVDTGAAVSVTPPGPNDKPDPNIMLETVDGSLMPAYGKTTTTFKLGRKTYHQDLIITNTSETILGMDFIKKYKMDNRWSEFGDYYLYDTKADISTLLEFIKMPKNSLPSVK